MPTWLVHGFRWPRPLIRIHIILQNLDDAAAEWLMAPATSAALTKNFHKLHPEMMANLLSLRFIEQYDPDDLTTKSQPYAYVCDQVHEVKLGVDVDELRGKGVANDAWSALADLRDKIAPGEKVAWFVVVNGDVERWAPPTVALLEGSSTASQVSPVSRRGSIPEEGEEDNDSDETKRQAKRFKRWFRGGKAKRSKRQERRILTFTLRAAY
ncbi:hypothetical protein K469DRAFT_682028 [Zopfia rhizophila CBS 207.26]|uniref:Uncharacterized protein n=1 Tax=Zopfia rhizophila CBS 207.26 TaxID=1314779 RepID=A0A6A6F074_9PEZI|nr:hypothetical protein K469DRAFT_682028 [Zopfia rhizophila CBS 207.26]